MSHPILPIFQNLILFSKLTVLSTAAERHFGGYDFDRALADYFAAEWKTKHGIDAHTNKKAMFRLMTACEKTKKILSANSQVWRVEDFTS